MHTHTQILKPFHASRLFNACEKELWPVETLVESLEVNIIKGRSKCTVYVGSICIDV